MTFSVSGERGGGRAAQARASLLAEARGGCIRVIGRASGPSTRRPVPPRRCANCVALARSAVNLFVSRPAKRYGVARGRPAVTGDPLFPKLNRSSCIACT